MNSPATSNKQTFETNMVHIIGFLIAKLSLCMIFAFKNHLDYAQISIPHLYDIQVSRRKKYLFLRN